jgi:transaldolase
VVRQQTAQWFAGSALGSHSIDRINRLEDAMASSLHQLAEQGQSPWIDYLSRRMVTGGDLAGLIDDGIVGVTSNPTILQGAIAEGDAYDEQLSELFEHEQDPKELFLALARRDVRNACDELRTVFERGQAARDGWVSLEVDPRLAYKAAETAAEAKRLHALVDRPNLFVKIPGTESGLAAVEETIAAGIPVNVTLLFSLRRHRAAAEAYIRGLRRLLDAGGDLSTVASVASFFVSRVDTEADRRLDHAEGYDELRGTLAIANAKLAYRTYQQIFSGPDWNELVRAGATAQRCLWASTSTKNPDYRDVRYVEELIGPETVNTMPRPTVEAFLDHGQVASTLQSDVDGAQRTFERFDEAGLDYDDIVAVLEREGVEAFVSSFTELLDGVDAKRRQLVTS